ncbi:c-type cytochrome [Undibacterium sp. Ji67W]|uniref:c-type cytochrome n=1 Tax=Undibacterium sp. Ji67W TaxID=3413042 RepID=UPI003BF12B77
MKFPVPNPTCLSVLKILLMLCSGMALPDANAAQKLPGSVRQGEALYQKLCVACHSLDYNGVGPAHRGVFGRRAGSVKDYNYSSALANSMMVWDESKLNSWLSNPEKLVPGQKMGISVASAQDRADLIAYLKMISQGQTTP